MAQAWDRSTSLHAQSMRTLAGYLALKDNNWLQDDSVDVVLGYLGVWKSYKAGILFIFNYRRPSALMKAQKLLGFSPSETSDDVLQTFDVLEGSLIHQQLSKSKKDDETEASASEVDTIIRDELPLRLHKMLDSLHAAALVSPWTQPRRFSASPPAPLIRSSSNIFVSNDNFSPKLHVLCKMIGVLDMPKPKDLTIIDQQWLYRMFGIMYPTSGEISPLSSLSSAPDSDDISTNLRNWLQRDWGQVRNAGASDVSITHLMLHLMVRSALHSELFEDEAPANLQLGPIRDAIFSSRMVNPLQGLFSKSGRHRLAQAVLFFEYVSFSIS